MWMSMEMAWFTILIQVKADLGQRFLVSSVGRALHRYRRGHGFKSRTGLIFFFRPYFHYCLSTVHYCEGHFRIHAFIRSSNIWPSYIHSRLYIWSSQTSTYICTIYLPLSIYLLSINIEVWRVKSISSSLGKSEGRSPQPHRLTNVCNEFWGKSFWRKYTAASVGGIKNNWILSTELIK